MAYETILPKTVNFAGSACSGVDGTASRTYTLSDSGLLSDGMTIIINGTALMSGASNDYTISAGVVTFLNIVDNTDLLTIHYFVLTSSSSESSLTSTSLKYATTEMLADVLGIKKSIPSWAVGSEPSNEEVGLGDNSTTLFYLDHQNILSDSYTLYYGATASATDVLTETTHYTIDVDTGVITLTATGVTLLDTNKLFAKYSYIDSGYSDSYLVTVLLRSEKEVDASVNSTFTDGTSSNPDYPAKTEIQATQGLFQNQWITTLKPVIDIVDELDGTITSTDSTLDVLDGTLFPTAGYIIIDSEVLSYTGISTNTLTGLTRGSLGTTAAAHTTAADIHTTLVFVSDTSEGTDETYTIQSWDSDVYVTEDGLITRFDDASPDTLSPLDLPNRFKIIYYYGNDSIPNDITRLTLLFAKRMLITDTVGKALVTGRDEFQPGMINADQEEIHRIVNSWIVLPMGNT